MSLPPLVHTEAGRGRPLVLVHAFPLDRTMWRPQLDGLADVARVIAPDLPGFGGSPPAESWSIDDAADAVANLLDRHGIAEKVVLGGLSMGGYVALAFARRHAQRLAGLILADTRAEADGAEAKAGRDKTRTVALEQGTAAVFEGMKAKALGDTTRSRRPEVVETAAAIADRQPGASTAAAVLALRDRSDATPGLAAIAVPTLILVGSEDAITPQSAAQTMADKIPGAKLVELPEAGHLSNLETPDAFNASVRKFLANGLGS